MALDGLFLSLLARELRRACIGTRVDKIFQPARQELIFLLRSSSDRNAGGRLLLSAMPSAARVQLTGTAPENPASPPMLCMLLRKKLTGAVLSGIRQEGLDRVLYLDFEGRDELGDPVTYTMVAELLGRAPNLIFLDGEGRIIDAVQRSSAEAQRLLMPGAKYQPPPPGAPKANLLTDSVEQIADAVAMECSELSKAIQQNIEGFAPLIAREIAHLTTRGAERSANCLTEEEKNRLRVFLRQHRELCEAGGKPRLYTKPDGSPFEFTYRSLSQYGMGAIGHEYDTYSGLLDAFFAKRARQERLRGASRDLLKLLSNAMERTAKKINLRKAELARCENREQQRIFGELLKANLHAIPKGAEVCAVPNYYEPDCPITEIPLNPALSPAENAQQYFKVYRKAHTAAKMLESLIDEAHAELAYLETVFDALARAESEREISEIRSELVSTSYIRRKNADTRKKAPKQAALPPLRFEKAGFEILVGRNNRQNDELTLRTADPKDLWFHTKTLPGSHVILRTRGQEPPQEAVLEAARLAALHSSARESGGVQVDYTRVRYVKKPPGAKPGMVIYDRFQTLYVRL